ncbi:MAG: TIGR02757 family protein [Mucinivorans sp.]
MTNSELKEHLDFLAQKYNCPEFIDNDPISIPHSFSSQGDIEISAFLVSTIAWGNRKMIVGNGHKMVERMDGAPEDFVLNASPTELDALNGFVHRTFNDFDFRYFVLALRRICTTYGSLGDFWQGDYLQTGDLRLTIARFRREFLDAPFLPRTSRHVSDITRGSACKRLVMMLRWMVRHDNCGVDFGFWRSIPTSALYIPLDVHAARQGRELGLLTRRQDDWRAVEELTSALSVFDPIDPARYDFALFGLGVNQK